LSLFPSHFGSRGVFSSYQVQLKRGNRHIIAMDAASTMKIVNEEWEAALPSLQDFVRIPNLSPNYDPDWATNGLLEKVTNHVADWVKAQKVEGCIVEVLEEAEYSPFLYVEVPATPGSDKVGTTFLMYGHLDKQPHGPGWDEGIEPTGALIKDGKLYGRGAGDDGYAVYGCIIALKALQKQGIAHPRIVILAETSEESGSCHLGHWVEKLADRIGEPNAVYCLDSGAEDYETLWMTTSLRGVVMGSLEVGVLTQGTHSGFGGGIAPDAFRVARQLLARVEDPVTGKILVPEMFTKIPVERQEQMKVLADKLGKPEQKLSYRQGALSQYNEAFEQYRANTWEPCMAVVGWEGLPPLDRAGNVLHPFVKFKVSFRIPPLVDAVAAGKAVKAILEKDPPYGATVKADFGEGHVATGWNAPEPSPQLEDALSKACSLIFDGKEMGFVGVGGTIPLMNMLGEMFPDSDLLCTGVLGPGTNMHGPNEMLPIEYTKKVTACVALVMGLIQPAKSSLPEGVPVPEVTRKPKTKRKFCFRQPEVPIGQCLCCL